jgi:hypothetical protein
MIEGVVMKTERGSRLFSFTDSTSSESDMHALAPLEGTTPILELCNVPLAVAVS